MAIKMNKTEEIDFDDSRLPHRRDPTVPGPRPSHQAQQQRQARRSTVVHHKPFLRRNRCQRCLRCIYNKDDGTILGRTCKSWIQLLTYAIVYLMFLAAFTMIMLFIALKILTTRGEYSSPSSLVEARLQYDVGLSVIPAQVNQNPYISYKIGKPSQYNVYIESIDKLIQSHRRTRDANTDLGPCGVRPYGYDRSPCVIVKINKQINWFAKPLQSNSTLKSVPDMVREWAKRDSKLWLHCDGHYPWDKEHIGNIKYYPDPPGFDPGRYPANMTMPSQLIGVQLSNFKLGMSLIVQCTMWYESGKSSVSFMLYVEPEHAVETRSGKR